MNKVNTAMIKNMLLMKIIVFILCLIPFFILVYEMITNQMGANPVERMTRFTGTWGFNFLLITLAITPLRRLLNLNALIRLRRMLGLYAFFYILLHFIIWFWLDHNFDTSEMLKDVWKRQFILAGFTAFVLMIPLTLTSFNKAIKKLGGKNWQRLHYLIYAIGISGVLHFWWMKSSKNNLLEPKIYASILTVLLVYRIIYKLIDYNKAKINDR